MFTERKPRTRSNVVVSNRTKNNLSNTKYLILRKVRPNSNTRKTYITPMSTNKNIKKSSSM
jgi:hypothetical protein